MVMRFGLAVRLRARSHTTPWPDTLPRFPPGPASPRVPHSVTHGVFATYLHKEQMLCRTRWYSSPSPPPNPHPPRLTACPAVRRRWRPCHVSARATRRGCRSSCARGRRPKKSARAPACGPSPRPRGRSGRSAAIEFKLDLLCSRRRSVAAETVSCTVPQPCLCARGRS